MFVMCEIPLYDIFCCFLSTLKRSLDMFKLRKCLTFSSLSNTAFQLPLFTVSFRLCVAQDMFLPLQRLNMWVYHTYNWRRAWGRRPRKWKNSGKNKKKWGKRLGWFISTVMHRGDCSIFPSLCHMQSWWRDTTLSFQIEQQMDVLHKQKSSQFKKTMDVSTNENTSEDQS